MLQHWATASFLGWLIEKSFRGFLLMNRIVLKHRNNYSNMSEGIRTRMLSRKVIKN